MSFSSAILHWQKLPAGHHTITHLRDNQDVHWCLMVAKQVTLSVRTLDTPLTNASLAPVVCVDLWQGTETICFSLGIYNRLQSLLHKVFHTQAVPFSNLRAHIPEGQCSIILVYPRCSGCACMQLQKLVWYWMVLHGIAAGLSLKMWHFARSQTKTINMHGNAGEHQSEPRRQSWMGSPCQAVEIKVGFCTWQA